MLSYAAALFVAHRRPLLEKGLSLEAFKIHLILNKSNLK